MFLEEIKMSDHKEEEIFEMKAEYPYVIRKIAPSLGRTYLVPWHWHQELEFVVVHQGVLEYFTPDKKVCVHPGEGLFVNTNVLHQLSTPEPMTPIKYDVHMFPREFIAPQKSLIDTKYLTPLLQCSRITVVDLQRKNPIRKRILDKLEQLAEWERAGVFGYEIQSRNLSAELMLDLFEDQKEYIYTESEPSFNSESRLKSMLLFIQEHYAEELSLKDIADAAHISERECLRCFQKMLRITPFAYLKSYRVQVACGLLSFTSDSIMTIAMKTGFSSSSYFGKTFRRHMNCTPNEYRKNSRAGTEVKGQRRKKEN